MFNPNNIQISPGTRYPQYLCELLDSCSHAWLKNVGDKTYTHTDTHIDTHTHTHTHTQTDDEGATMMIVLYAVPLSPSGA